MVMQPLHVLQRKPTVVRLCISLTDDSLDCKGEQFAALHTPSANVDESGLCALKIAVVDLSRTKTLLLPAAPWQRASQLG